MRTYRWMGWATAVAVALGVFTAGISRSEAVEERKPAGQSWEYRVVLVADMVPGAAEPRTVAATLESKFNDLGRDGWDLAEHINGAVVLKRPRK